MTIRLAVPNKGRLQQPAAHMLEQGGFSYEKTERALSVPVRNMDLEVLFVRTDDVAEFVADGVADLGITGIDLLTESGSKLEIIERLGFGHCRLTAGRWFVGSRNSPRPLGLSVLLAGCSTLAAGAAR